MRIKTKKATIRTKKEAMVNIPLSALRCILRYPKERKIVCEIDTPAMKRMNEPKTLDEIINAARIDYALDNFKTFTSAKDLLAELER